MAKSSTEIQAADINGIILRARELQPTDAERRLGAMVFALVVEIKSCGLTKHDALRRVREAFNTPITTASQAPGVH